MLAMSGKSRLAASNPMSLVVLGFRNTSAALAEGVDVSGSVRPKAAESSLTTLTEVSFGYKPFAHKNLVDFDYKLSRRVADTFPDTNSSTNFTVTKELHNVSNATNLAGVGMKRLWLNADHAMYMFALQAHFPTVAVLGSVFRAPGVITLANT
jgi:hypothetical protein